MLNANSVTRFTHTPRDKMVQETMLLVDSIILHTAYAADYRYLYFLSKPRYKNCVTHNIKKSTSHSGRITPFPVST